MPNGGLIGFYDIPRYNRFPFLQDRFGPVGEHPGNPDFSGFDARDHERLALRTVNGTAAGIKAEFITAGHPFAAA